MMHELWMFTKASLLRWKWVLLGCLLVFGLYGIMHQHVWINDERLHFYQILLFDANIWRMDYVFTTFPGFHAVISFLARITNAPQEAWSYRLLATIVSILTIIGSYLATEKLMPQQSKWRVLQVAVLPIVAIFYTQLHTEGISLALVAMGVGLTLQRKYWPAMLFVTASVLIRQQNILWAAFVPFLAALDNNKPILQMETIQWMLQKFWFLIVVALAFALFILENGGVVLGDKGHHNAGFFFTNIIGFFAFSGLLLWPSYIEKLRNNWATIWPFFQKYWWLFILAIIATMAVYNVLFELTHPFLFRGVSVRNGGDFATLFERGGSFKTYFLDHVRLHPIERAGFLFWSAISTIGTISLFQKRQMWWALAFSSLVLLPQDFITPRYWVIPLFLLATLRQQSSSKTEVFQFLYFALIHGIIVYYLYLSPTTIHFF